MTQAKQTQNRSTRARALTTTGLVSALIALAIAAPGCALSPSDDDHSPTVQIAPEAAEYVARFERSADTYGRAVAVNDLIVQFGDVDGSRPGEGGARGVCDVASGHTPVVTLSREAWDGSSDDEREELVFHELGHCLLGLTHEGGVNSKGIPKSVMNPTEIDGAIYKQNRDFYLQGLFGAK